MTERTQALIHALRERGGEAAEDRAEELVHLAERLQAGVPGAGFVLVMAEADAESLLGGAS